MQHPVDAPIKYAAPDSYPDEQRTAQFTGEAARFFTERQKADNQNADGNGR